MSDNRTSPSFYVAVFVALIALTLLTVGLGFCDLGPWHFAAGMAIAVAKATLVILFFMHVISSPRLTWLVFAAGLFWFGILMSLTLADYLTRAWLAY